MTMKLLLMTLALTGFAVANDLRVTDPAVAVASSEDVKEFKGKILAVDRDASTIRLEGYGADIVLTDKTRFGAGVSMEELKPGLTVKITVVARPDGKLEAQLVEAAV